MEFPAGHPGRDDRGFAGGRQHGHRQAVQRNAHHRRQIRRGAAGSRLPGTVFTLLTGSGAAVGDVLVQHPKTRFVAFTGSRDVGLRINELAAKAQPGQIWIKRVIAEMGGKDAIIVDADCDLDKAVEGVLRLGVRILRGRNARPARAPLWTPRCTTRFLEKLASRKFQDQGGRRRRSRQLHGAGDQRRRAAHHSANISRWASRKGRLVRAKLPFPKNGYFVPPTVIADVDSKAAFSRRRFSARCWR
jgi:1-pyrroline-5-carboxylate dehydrogenase